MVTSTAYPHDPPTELMPDVLFVHGRMHPANIGPPWKKTMTKPGGSLRPDFDRLLEHSLDNLVGAHGQPLMGGAHDALSKTVDRVFG